MEYENIRMPELKVLARERRLRGYSRMRKAELVALLQNSSPPGQSHASTSPTQTWEPMDDRRPRKPSPQEMDIFEQQEMSKSRPQVKGKLNKWYNWLINHVPKPIKDGASNASVNSKHQHPPPGQPPGIFPNFQPGSRDLYHLNFPGIPGGRTYYIMSKYQVAS